MNENEMKMIEEMAETCNKHTDCLLCRYSPKTHSKRFWGEMWKSGCPNGDKKLVYAMSQGYRKVADDEIVIKKSEYDTLLKTYTQIYDNAYHWGLKVGEEKTATEILQEIVNAWNKGEYMPLKLALLATKFGIKLED